MAVDELSCMYSIKLARPTAQLGRTNGITTVLLVNGENVHICNGKLPSGVFS